MMKVQQYLREHGLQKLKEERFIEVREYPEYGLLKLNYSQIDSPKTDPVVMECRGLLLDSDFNVVSRTFKRFFNYGEADTKNFDFTDAIVTEKCDGSLVAVYFCPQTNQWEIATRGTAFAEANHVFGLKQDLTFRQAILEAMCFTEEEFQVKAQKVLNPRKTYVLEYCSFANRIVVQYTGSFVVLLAIVDNESGEEASQPTLGRELAYMTEVGMNVRLPKMYNAASGDELAKLASQLPNLEEGFVVYQPKTGERVKIKSATYCAVHHLRGNGTPSRARLVEVVLKNEQAELLQYFPEFIGFIEPLEVALSEVKKECDSVYNSAQHLESQKDFAIAVKDTKVSSVMFKARKDKLSPLEAWHSLSVSQQESILEKFL